MEFSWWDESLVAEEIPEDVDLNRYVSKQKKDNTTADQAFQVGEIGARMGFTVKGIAAVVAVPTGADYVIPLQLLNGEASKNTPYNYWIYFVKPDGRKQVVNAGVCLVALQQKGAGNNRTRVHNFALAIIGEQDASGKPNPKPTPAQLDEMIPGLTEYAEIAATKLLGSLAVK